MLKLFGTTVSGKAILVTQVHNVVEIVGMTGWLTLVLRGQALEGFIVLAVTLTVEHILALAAGKLA